MPRRYNEFDRNSQQSIDRYFERERMLEQQRQDFINDYFRRENSMTVPFNRSFGFSFRRPSSSSEIMTGTQTSTRSKLDVPEKLNLKTPTFSFNSKLPEPVVKPVDVNSTKIKEPSIKPTQQFARYPGMKKGFFGKLKDRISGLMQNRMVNGRNVGNITATGPSFLSGAKSVKGYRGDENLPEAKKGMKNCGCKHPKKRYKYQAGTDELNLSPETESPLARRQRLLAGIATGETDLRKVTRLTPEVKEVAKKPVNKYVSYNEMSDEDKEAYRKGMASGKDFEVGGRKYAAVPKKKTQKSEVVVRQKTQESKPSPAPIKKTSVSQIIPPTVKGDSWTEEQWKDFLKKKNAPVEKPVPVIPKAKPKPVLPLNTSLPGYKPSKPIYEFDVKVPKEEQKKQTPKVVKTENRKNRVINTNWNPNDETSLIDKILPEGDVKEVVKNNPIQRWPGIAKNWAKRKWDLMNPEDEVVSTGFKEPSQPAFTVGAKPVNKTKSIEQYKSILQSNPMIVGDTVKIKDLGKDRYYLNEKIDLNDPALSFGTRSRDEFPEGGINTEAAPITTTEPWQSSKNFNFDENSEYIGVNSRGKIKTGKAKDFKDDDYKVSKAYLFNIENFASDEKGNQLFSPDESNKGFDLPVVNFITPSGEKRTANINLMVPKTKNSKYNESAFGPTSGGGFIIESPDQKERILIRGSLKDIRNEFNQMKSKGKYQYLRVIPMDNGSFARGLRTMDQNLDKKDLETYDAQNTKGGHVAYIKSRSKKYKYGTSALTIPEGSAIVTANEGKNMQALKAYKKGNYKLLNKIIDDMPEDKPSEFQKGGKKIKGKVRRKTSSGKTFNEQSAHGYKGYGKEMSEEDAKKLYGLSLKDLYEARQSGKLSKVSFDLELARRQAVSENKKEFDFDDGTGSKKYLSGYEEEETPNTTIVEKKPEDKPIEPPKPPQVIPTPIPPPPPGQTPPTTSNKRRFNIPSLAEVAARGSILAQGVEGVPENYLKLGRYDYASQLNKTLREIQLSEQAGRETARDIVAGDAGRYLAQSASLSAAGMKAANDAVIQDTLARQDIFNKNVDLGNIEAQTNRSLKDQYAMQKAANRGAFNNQLISLGQGIDTAMDASKLMGSQMDVDDIRTNLLKSKDYYMDPQGNIRMGKKGIKKVKTYKRK
jgi:hypothetical protein